MRRGTANPEKLESRFFRVNSKSKQDGSIFEIVESGKEVNLSMGAGEKKIVLLLGGGGPSTFRLRGEGAELTLLGVIVGQGNDDLLMEVEVIHEKPRTKAEIILKGAVFDEAKVNIKGSVKINKGAKISEDQLREDILLLGKGARGEAYPYLEIEENDVVAKHAATVGRLDREQMFYLMSRGLSDKESESLLVRGFLMGVLERVPKENGDKIERQLVRMLEKGGANGNLDKNL